MLKNKRDYWFIIGSFLLSLNKQRQKDPTKVQNL